MVSTDDALFRIDGVCGNGVDPASPTAAYEKKTIAEISDTARSIIAEPSSCIFDRAPHLLVFGSWLRIFASHYGN
jgi:hypothetical protein